MEALNTGNVHKNSGFSVNKLLSQKLHKTEKYLLLNDNRNSYHSVAR